jgi:hypothetical protein
MVAQELGAQHSQGTGKGKQNDFAHWHGFGGCLGTDLQRGMVLA